MALLLDWWFKLSRISLDKYAAMFHSIVNSSALVTRKSRSVTSDTPYLPQSILYQQDSALACNVHIFNSSTAFTINVA